MPEPVLVAISAALATKAVTTLYDFVRTRFATRKEAAAALAAAEGAEPDSAEVRALADELHKAESADPDFGAELRKQWQTVQQTGVDQSTFTISGTMHNSRVVQAKEIKGDISF